MATIVEDVQANERALEKLLPDLEKTHPGHWVVIAQGELVAVSPTREGALREAARAVPGARSRLIRRVGDRLPQTVRKL